MMTWGSWGYNGRVFDLTDMAVSNPWGDTIEVVITTKHGDFD